MGQESSVEKALHDAIDTLIAFRSSFNQITVGPEFDEESYQRSITEVYKKFYDALLKLEEALRHDEERRYSWISFGICSLMEYETKNYNPDLLDDPKFAELYERNRRLALHEFAKLLWAWKPYLKGKLSVFSIMNFTQAIAPDEPEVWIQSGEFQFRFAKYYRDKDKEKYENHIKLAKEKFKKALQLAPDSRQALLSLGHIAFEEKDYDSALSYYIKLSELFGHKRRYYLESIANVYEAKGDFSKAIEIYEKVLELELSSLTRSGVYATLARLYHKAGNQQKVFEIIKKIEEMKSGQMDYWRSYYNYLADAYEYAGLIQEAIRAIKEAIEHGRSIPKEERSTYYALSEFYQRLCKLLRQKDTH